MANPPLAVVPRARLRTSMPKTNLASRSWTTRRLPYAGVDLCLGEGPLVGVEPATQEEETHRGVDEEALGEDAAVVSAVEGEVGETGRRYVHPTLFRVRA